MLKNYLLHFTLLAYIQTHVYAQGAQPDSLAGRDYDYLYERIDERAGEPQKQVVYMKAFLQRAKLEGNKAEIINGYKNYVYYSPEHQKLAYADSMVSLARQIGDNSAIGAAYLTKGIVYYGQKNRRQALDNYLLANSYISRTSDRYLSCKVKYNMAQIKYYLGFYQETISLLRECMAYFKDHDERGYLNCLHSLGLCYNKIGDYGLSAQCNKEGIAVGKSAGIQDMEAYFIHSQAINEYANRNYNLAIKKMRIALPGILQKKDFANETVDYFYIGKSYWAQGKKEMAVAYFLKVDRNFRDKNYIRPDLRETYELLIQYYKGRNELKLQLHYIEKLIRADRVIEGNFKYLSGKVHKDYDTRELLAKKKQIELALEHRRYNDYLYGGVILLLFTILFFVVRKYRANQKRYRKKFEELMAGATALQMVGQATQKSRGEANEMNGDAQAGLTKMLDKFEKDGKFLDNNLTLVKMAAAFNSNTKYLSRVIMLSRGKKFTEYINDLKIDYLISLLKQDSTLLNYTNKALGEEVGFSSTQRFANAFFARTGIPAVFFIEEMKKQNEAQKESASDKQA